MKRAFTGQPVVQPLNSNDAEVPEDDILNFFKAGQTSLNFNKISLFVYKASHNRQFFIYLLLINVSVCVTKYFASATNVTISSPRLQSWSSSTLSSF